MNVEKVRAYYQLTKPGILKGNAVHVIAGALMASVTGISLEPIIAVLIGTSFVIASACVANNYIDRDIDRRMKRTKNRASVTGYISVRNASIFAATLGSIGFAVLVVFTNSIVVCAGIVAYITYVALYGYVKRRSTLSTLVGAIPGALPALAGYVAVTGELSIAAGLVFLLVFVWQMPHFYAISLFRKKEYAAAKVPVLGVVKPFYVVRRHMLAFMIAYLGVVLLLITFMVVGPPSGLLLLAGAAYWLVVFAVTDTKNETKWARMIFGASLLLTLVLLVASGMNVAVPPIR